MTYATLTSLKCVLTRASASTPLRIRTYPYQHTQERFTYMYYLQVCCKWPNRRVKKVVWYQTSSTSSKIMETVFTNEFQFSDQFTLRCVNFPQRTRQIFTDNRKEPKTDKRIDKNWSKRFERRKIFKLQNWDIYNLDRSFFMGREKKIFLRVWCNLERWCWIGGMKDVFVEELKNY